MPDEVVSELPLRERPPRPALRIQIPPNPFRPTSPTELPSDHSSDSSIHSSQASGTGSLFGPRSESNLQSPPARPPPRTIPARRSHQVLRAPPIFPPRAFADRLLPPRPDPIDMRISVFPARQEDYRQLLEVQTSSLQNFRTHVDFRTWSRWTSRRTARINDHSLVGYYEDGTLWVAAAKLATGENWIVGFAACNPWDTWPTSDTEGLGKEVVHYIRIHVDVSFRRMGVGSQLLEQVEEYMWRKGCGYLVASAFEDVPWKEPEQAFLKKNDFQRLNVLGWHVGPCPIPHI